VQTYPLIANHLGLGRHLDKTGTQDPKFISISKFKTKCVAKRLSEKEIWIEFFLLRGGSSRKFYNSLWCHAKSTRKCFTRVP
jgi:hypothetical protein